jgi:hypothetical protein
LGNYASQKIDCSAAIKQLQWLKEQLQRGDQVIAPAKRKEALAVATASQQSAKKPQ